MTWLHIPARYRERRSEDGQGGHRQFREGGEHGFAEVDDQGLRDGDKGKVTFRPEQPRVDADNDEHHDRDLESWQGRDQYPVLDPKSRICACAAGIVRPINAHEMVPNPPKAKNIISPRFTTRRPVNSASAK